MIPTSPQVERACEPNLLITRLQKIHKGLVLCLPDLDSSVEHFFTVIVEGLRVSISAKRKDTEGHLRITKRETPRSDHLGKHLTIHPYTKRPVKRVVVTLMKNCTLDG